MCPGFWLLYIAVPHGLVRWCWLLTRPLPCCPVWTVSRSAAVFPSPFPPMPRTADLESEDNTKPIYLYINSPGGSVIAGLALFDTMKHIKSEIVTINVGLAASMASFLLAAGEPGKRLALPHSRVMIHQPMGGAQGQAADIKVEAEQILRIKKNLVAEYARMTGQTVEAIVKDLNRDNFMSAEAAKEYGLIDMVIEGKSQAG